MFTETRSRITAFFETCWTGKESVLGCQRVSAHSRARQLLTHAYESAPAPTTLAQGEKKDQHVQFSVALRPQKPYALQGTGEPRTATSSTFTQLLTSEPLALCLVLVSIRKFAPLLLCGAECPHTSYDTLSPFLIGRMFVREPSQQQQQQQQNPSETSEEPSDTVIHFYFCFFHIHRRALLSANQRQCSSNSANVPSTC